MIRLKIILQSKLFYLILILFTVIYSFIILKYEIYLTKYNVNSKYITGTVTNIKYKDTMNIIEVRTSIFEKVLVYDYDKVSISIGTKVKVEGTIDMPENNSNFYLFNYRKYLLSMNTHYIMKLDRLWILNRGNIFYKVKRNIIKRINKIDNPYLNTFILGDNSKLDDNIIHSYQVNGISHLFAVSGMHIGLIVLVLEFILHKFKIKNKLIIIIFILFYIFLTNYSKSIIRAGLLYILLLLNKRYKFRLSTLKILLLLLCVSLIISPYNLYNISFIFTYLVTIALVLNKRLINRFSNYFIKILITSFIAFIVTIPATINNYYSINILGVILNIVFVPLVSLIIFPLSIIVFIIPCMCNVFNIFIYLLEKLSIIFSSIKLFQITLCHINTLVFVLYYLIIIIVLYMFNKGKYSYIVLLIILIIIHYNYRLIDSNYYYVMLDVKQGDSSLLIFPHNKCNIMIDTGGIYNNDLTSNVLIPSLKSRGIKKLDYIIITHGDNDHLGEVINLVSRFKVDNVIFNIGNINSIESSIISVLEKKKIKYYIGLNNLKINNNTLYFLNTKKYDNENDNSNILYFKLDSYKFLLLGDASVTTEHEILDKYNLSDIDVLKVGHHGSRTSSSKEFINEINPKYSVISVGKNNRYGHPNKEVLDNLNDSKVYRTDQDGSIMFKIKKDNLKIETCSP